MEKVRATLKAILTRPANQLLLDFLGSVHEFGSPEYNALLPEGSRHAGSRAVVVLDVFKVATVCCSILPAKPHVN